MQRSRVAKVGICGWKDHQQGHWQMPGYSVRSSWSSSEVAQCDEKSKKCINIYLDHHQRPIKFIESKKYHPASQLGTVRTVVGVAQMFGLTTATKIFPTRNGFSPQNISFS